MSQDNVEIAQQGYEAINQMLRRREVDRSVIEALWTADTVLRPAGILPESIEMHRHEGLARFISNQMEAFDEMGVEPLEFIDAGDRVVVPIRFGGKARYTGMEVAFEVVHVVTMRDGKCERTDMYRDKAEALEAVGLAE
jgi:ketosteroid isomerase-like protein